MRRFMCRIVVRRLLQRRFSPMAAQRMQVRVTRRMVHLRVVLSPSLHAALTASGSARKGSTPVNINTATAEELQTLPRIGPAMAQRIIAWREAHGGFRSVDELDAVPVLVRRCWRICAAGDGLMPGQQKRCQNRQQAGDGYSFDPAPHLPVRSYV